MRLAAAFFAVTLLAACATAPAAPAGPGAQSRGAAGPSHIQQLLASAGAPNAATREEMERALGAPFIARQDGAGAALTYRWRTCALLLLFVADGRNVPRLAEAHASARRPGEAAPSVELCAAEAGAP